MNIGAGIQCYFSDLNTEVHMLDADTLVFFTEEVLEMLPNWEKECLKLEEDMSNPEYDALFRLAHNIKGSSKMVGLDSMGDVVHHAEDIINFLRDGTLKLQTNHVNLFLDVHSLLCDWIDNLGEDPSYSPDVSSLQTKMDEIKESANAPAAQEPGESETSDNKKKIETLESRLGQLKEQSEVVHEYSIEEDLIIENMEGVISKIELDPDGKCLIELLGTEIDTAGIQYLLMLKKFYGERLSINCDNSNVIEACGWLGAEKVLLK